MISSSEWKALKPKAQIDSACHVPLTHELRNHTVKGTSLVTKAGFTSALIKRNAFNMRKERILPRQRLLASRDAARHDTTPTPTHQLPKVFGRLGDNIGTQLKLDASNIFPTYFHVKVDCRTKYKERVSDETDKDISLPDDD